MNENELNELIKQRDILIENNPKLRSLQNKIDEILDKTPQQYRPTVMNLLLSGALLKLTNELNNLTKLLGDL